MILWPNNTIDAAMNLLLFTKHTQVETSHIPGKFCFNMNQFQELTRLLDILESALRKDGFIKTQRIGPPAPTKQTQKAASQLMPE